MPIALWIVQGLLALVFLATGFTKLTQPIQNISKQMSWVTAVPLGFVRFIGVAALAGALGCILPAVTKIAPIVTGYAGIGLVLIQVLAALTRSVFLVTHLQRHL